MPLQFVKKQSVVRCGNYVLTETYFNLQFEITPETNQVNVYYCCDEGNLQESN